MSNPPPSYWLHPDLKENKPEEWETVESICLGTGRFLRAVLVPLLSQSSDSTKKCLLVQPRGRSFVDGMLHNSVSTKDGCYDVDTVLEDGSIETSHVPVAGAFTWSTPETTRDFYEKALPHCTNLRILGVGVTEAGLASADTPIMKALYHFLCQWCRLQQHLPSRGHKLCIIDMDNVPHNGQTLERHMQTLANQDENKETMRCFLDQHVTFLDTMVDRITSQREGSNGLVPRAEPVPLKALVILDPQQSLPQWFTDDNNNNNKKQGGGLVIRTQPSQLQADLDLKLRIANGTHTALAHLLALLQYPMTHALATDAKAAIFMSYVDALVADQVLPAVADELMDEAHAAWHDWRRRLLHPHFGLSTFFITQNGAAKGGIRLGPTVVDLVLGEKNLTVTMALALAVLLRWLTQAREQSQTHTNNNCHDKNRVYRGWFPRVDPNGSATESYADGLSHNFQQGWYEFKCHCPVWDPATQQTRNLADWLASIPQGQPSSYVSVIRAYLVASEGGNQASVGHTSAFEDLCHAMASLYARMVAGDDLYEMLQEMKNRQGPYVQGWSTPCQCLVDSILGEASGPLHYRASPVPSTSVLLEQAVVSLKDLSSVVASEVASVVTIDLHTHLLPPTHGPLCLWGIDELLTYHYLVAEYFMTAPPEMTPEAFYAKTKQEQADLIWQALFIDRSPISEACRGVVTALMALGLSNQVQTRDLSAIRAFYASFRDRGAAGASEFSDLVFQKAGVRYNIMTNIPFDSNEAQFWRPQPTGYSHHYRSALRVDPLLAGDRAKIETTLRASGYALTLEGARQYLRDWCDTMKPEYMMASTPHNFVWPENEGSLTTVANSSRSINTEAMKEPGAFAKVQVIDDCNPTSEDAPSLINEQSDFLAQVLMKVCEERDLPLALKIGAHRAVNPRLLSAGDGVVAFADTSVLARLCTNFPKVRFLATFLSRNNQHEACVLASKFRNLHLYGCWWYCNNPSIIAEISQMRLEMLGTACTLQHSDARVLDQLLYKWPHSRSVIASVLQHEYTKLSSSGWCPKRADIRRDVERLFGQSYEEFMNNRKMK